VKVQANLEIDMKSQLLEANNKISDLEHRLHLQEMENQRLLHLLHDKEEIINHLTQEDLQPVTEAESDSNDRLVIVLNEEIKTLESNDLNGIRQVIYHELKGYRKPVLLDIMCRLSSVLSLLHKEVLRAASLAESKAAPSHARKMYQDHRSLSMDSKFDDYPSDSGVTHHGTLLNLPVHHTNSSGVDMTHIIPSDSVHDPSTPRLQSVNESPTQSPKPHSLHREPSVKHGLSRKLKPFLDGTTIISHGMFGVKYKTLSLSSDGKTISWKELSMEKEGKSFLLSECDRYPSLTLLLPPLLSQSITFT
jgi:hypothetical protein